jgi:hypothetical protein
MAVDGVLTAGALAGLATTPITVPNGGTGATSFTTDRFLRGAGISAITAFDLFGTANTWTANQTITGTLTATSFSGSGAGLTGVPSRRDIISVTDSGVDFGSGDVALFTTAAPHGLAEGSANVQVVATSVAGYNRLVTVDVTPTPTTFYDVGLLYTSDATGGAWYEPGTLTDLANAGSLGFFGHAAIAKPTVSGSRGGNAALQSLLTALANLGLITDSSS